jgi:hypothetical protein
MQFSWGGDVIGDSAFLHDECACGCFVVDVPD